MILPVSCVDSRQSRPVALSCGCTTSSSFQIGTRVFLFGEKRMQRILTTQLAGHTGERVVLKGWLYQLRALGKINFVLVRDGYGIAQAMTQDPAPLEALHSLQNETVLEVEGTVAAEPQAPGGHELHDIVVRVLTPVHE